MDAQLEMHTKQRWVFNDRGQEQSHFPSRHESRHKYSDDKLTGEAQYNNSPQCCQIICSCSVDIFAPATVTTPWLPCLHLNVGKTQRSITYGRKDPAIFWKRFLKGWKLIVQILCKFPNSQDVHLADKAKESRKPHFSMSPVTYQSHRAWINIALHRQTDWRTEGQRQARGSK